MNQSKALMRAYILYHLFSLCSITGILFICEKETKNSQWVYDSSSFGEKNLRILRIYRCPVRKQSNQPTMVPWLIKKDLKLPLSIGEETLSQERHFCPMHLCARFLWTAVECSLYQKYKQRSLQAPCRCNKMNSDGLSDDFRAKAKQA